jgi:hypothetical protein
MKNRREATEVARQTGGGGKMFGKIARSTRPACHGDIFFS